MLLLHAHILCCSTYISPTISVYKLCQLAYPIYGIFALNFCAIHSTLYAWKISINPLAEKLFIKCWWNWQLGYLFWQMRFSSLLSLLQMIFLFLFFLIFYIFNFCLCYLSHTNIFFNDRLLTRKFCSLSFCISIST